MPPPAFPRVPPSGWPRAPSARRAWPDASRRLRPSCRRPGSSRPWTRGRGQKSFPPVAGRKQDDFGEVAAQLEPAAAALEPRAVHRELLPQFHRRGLIAQSCNEDFHFGWLTVLTFWIEFKLTGKTCLPFLVICCAV